MAEAEKKKKQKEKSKTVDLAPELLPLEGIPIERDTRYHRRGYQYTTKEQWQADRSLVQMAMQDQRAEIAIKIFDTDNTATPTAFLRRFYAGTGVQKNKTMNHIVADLLNAGADGWPQLYKKWCQMDPDTHNGATLWLGSRN